MLYIIGWLHKLRNILLPLLIFNLSKGTVASNFFPQYFKISCYSIHEYLNKNQHNSFWTLCP